MDLYFRYKLDNLIDVNTKKHIILKGDWYNYHWHGTRGYDELRHATMLEF